MTVKEKQLLVLDQVPFREAKKRSDGTWDICVITPGWGSSGYYSEDLLKTDGVKVLTEGLQMFWDHASVREEYDRPERSLRDLAGVLAETVKWEDEGWNGPGLYSSAKVFRDYEESLEDPNFADAIGVSVVVYGTSHVGEAEGETGDIIDNITAARSVDFVTLPGRGGKVKARFESLRRDVIKPKEAKEVNEVDEQEARQLRESIRSLEDEKRTLAESKKELETEVTSLRSENKTLQGRLVLVEAGKKVAEVLDKVKGMPDAVKKRLAEAIIEKAPVDKDGELDEKEFSKLIEKKLEEEVDYLKTLGFGKVSGLGGTSRMEEADDDPDDDDDDEEDDEEEDAKPESKRGTKTERRLERAFLEMGSKDKTAKLASIGR